MRILLLLLLLISPVAQAVQVVVASKQFTESHLLAELAAELLEQEGHQVELKLGLGGSLVVFNALQAGDIDLYPDYTGTLAQTLLQDPAGSQQQLEVALAEIGLEIVTELGFNNSYVLAMQRHRARSLGITRISDLVAHPQLRAAFSLEFLKRHDGWEPLQRLYQLPQQVRGIEHALSYLALAEGQADLTDAFSTDGELQRYDLALLEDDKHFFPRYDAVIVARTDLDSAIRAQLQTLRGLLPEDKIQTLNAAAAEQSPHRVARQFLDDRGLLSDTHDEEASIGQSVLRNTLVHIKLTLTALVLACLVAIPLGLALANNARRSAVAIYLAGLLQTIPSLALLALMIPLLGLGQVPAITALFLYSLLPILRNTLTGLAGVDPLLKQVADGMGLTQNQRLRKIEIPLALPTILAGIKTAAIISIGTATLAAFVGAGGLGEPILTGLTLNNHSLILQGAIPAAALAIITEFLFEWLEQSIVPSHLRQQIA